MNSNFGALFSFVCIFSYCLRVLCMGMNVNGLILVFHSFHFFPPYINVMNTISRVTHGTWNVFRMSHLAMIDFVYFAAQNILFGSFISEKELLITYWNCLHRNEFRKLASVKLKFFFISSIRMAGRGRRQSSCDNMIDIHIT